MINLFQYRDVPKLFDFNTTIIPYSQTFFSSSNLIVYYKYRIIIEFSKQLLHPNNILPSIFRRTYTILFVDSLFSKILQLVFSTSIINVYRSL